MSALVQVSYPAERVGLLIMHNPPQNFGTYELVEKIGDGLEAVKQAGCAVAILASDVPGYFMAHAWLPDIVAAYSGGSVSGDPRSWRRVANELERGPLISIAANNGQAWGGGSELSWACNLRIAARSATYAQIECLLGIIPGAGGSIRLARLVGQAKAMEVILSCDPIGAEEALRLGLVHRVVDDDRLLEEVIVWATRIAARPRWALQAAKRAIQQCWDLHFEDAVRLEGYVFNSTVRRETLEILRAVQGRYEAGAEPREALGL